METPYRLKTILSDVIKVFGGNKKIVIAFDLTLPNEKFYRDNAASLLKLVSDKKLKGEFVILINNK
jgi:16S rRNA (cytidine1402-2'-O)-methyltransferase